MRARLLILALLVCGVCGTVALGRGLGLPGVLSRNLWRLFWSVQWSGPAASLRAKRGE